MSEIRASVHPPTDNGPCSGRCRSSGRWRALKSGQRSFEFRRRRIQQQRQEPADERARRQPVRFDVTLAERPLPHRDHHPDQLVEVDRGPQPGPLEQVPVAGAAAFAGAWVDGPGFRGFRPGRNLLWDTLSQQVVYPLAPRLRDAQAPKGMCLPAGPVNRVLPMVQERLPVQLLRIGPLYLVGIPAEVTIVAGLRLRRTVAEIVGADLADVLVAGYSNTYAHYVTTPEEYDAQEYEGGSTLFGRWELPALCQSVAGLAEAMRDGRRVARGTPERIRPQRSRPRRRGHDAPHPGRAFGDVLAFARTGSLVTARFVGAHPGNDLHRGGTYLAVERMGEDGVWTVVADDGDWSTTFRWARAGQGRGRRRPR